MEAMKVTIPSKIGGRKNAISMIHVGGSDNGLTLCCVPYDAIVFDPRQLQEVVDTYSKTGGGNLEFTLRAISIAHDQEGAIVVFRIKSGIVEIYIEVNGDPVCVSPDDLFRAVHCIIDSGDVETPNVSMLKYKLDMALKDAQVYKAAHDLNLIEAREIQQQRDGLAKLRDEAIRLIGDAPDGSLLAGIIKLKDELEASKNLVALMESEHA